MSLGATMAGINVALAVESNQHAVRSYVQNHPTTSVHCQDIRSFTSPPDIRACHDPVVLFGGPPCQGFSTSNQRTRSVKNTNNWLFEEFFRIARECKPEWIVFENVQGIRETEGGLFLQEIQDRFSSLGYTYTSFPLKAHLYGVPQRRTRHFVVGSLTPRPFPIPPPRIETPVTVYDAIADLPYLDPGASTNVLPYRTPHHSSYAARMRGTLQSCSGHLVTRNALYILERYRHIPPGGNWRDIPPHLMENYSDVRRCHTGIYRRLHYELPSVVIGNYRKNMLIHPAEDRGLSVREAARLQSFPDNYTFSGSIGLQQQQVGNAVPPLLAQAVFEEIIKIQEQDVGII